MGFREQGMPETCYFGCPEIDFSRLELAANTAERDVILAEQAGVSDSGLAAMREVAVAQAVNLEAVTGCPAEKLTAPWRPEVPREIKGKITSVECCRISTIVALDFTGKSGIHRIQREPKT